MRKYVLLQNGEVIGDPIPLSDAKAQEEADFWDDINRRIGEEKFEIKEVLH